MISTKQYMDTYNAWCDSLTKSAVAISKSSETRKYLIKNSDSAPLDEMLVAAVSCIADLTGDECFRKQVLEKLERRKNETS